MTLGKWEEHAVHVTAELERLNDGQREMGGILHQNTLVLEKNTILLEEHMRRTEAVERLLEAVQANTKEELKSVEAQIEPIRNAQVFGRYAIKIGGAIVALISAGVGIVKLWEFFHE